MVPREAYVIQVWVNDGRNIGETPPAVPDQANTLSGPLSPTVQARKLSF
jgi:hypothetical protein